MNCNNTNVTNVNNVNKVDNVNEVDELDDFSVNFTDSDNSSDESDESDEKPSKPTTIRQVIELKYHEVVINAIDRSDELKVIHEIEFKTILGQIEAIITTRNISTVNEYLSIRTEVFDIIFKFMKSQNGKRYFDISMLYLYFLLYIYNNYANSQWFVQDVMSFVTNMLQERNTDNKNNYRVFMMLDVTDDCKVTVDTERMDEHYLSCAKTEDGVRDVTHPLRKWHVVCDCSSHGCYAIRSARNVAERFNKLIGSSKFVGNNSNGNNNNSNGNNNKKKNTESKQYVCPVMLKILRNKEEHLKCVAIFETLLCHLGKKKLKSIPVYVLRWVVSTVFYINNGIHGKIVYDLFYSAVSKKDYTVYGEYKNNGSDAFYCSKPHNLIEQMVHYVQNVDNIFYLKNYTGPERINHHCGKRKRTVEEDEEDEEDEEVKMSPLELLSSVAKKMSKM